MSFFGKACSLFLPSVLSSSSYFFGSQVSDSGEDSLISSETSVLPSLLIPGFVKTLGTLVLVLLMGVTLAQTSPDHPLLDSAKAIFKNEKALNQAQLNQVDYQSVEALLQQVIALHPEHAEAHYFLGYTYSRLNARDGRGMLGMQAELVRKASDHLEKVIAVSPQYTGEMIVLDPYSKLTAEWGSLAMSYWAKNQNDSALWAFGEGKRRGGFGAFILEINKAMLNSCEQNGILISSGDNFSIPLWYLQLVENVRPDVSVVDISLLNTDWYPTFLEKNNIASFSLPKETLDTLNYTRWRDSTIHLSNFSWMVRPSYGNQYLLRGDQLFLSLLQANDFKRKVYFTIGFGETQSLSLGNYLKPLVFIDALHTTEGQDLTFGAYKKVITQALKLTKVLNQNSTDQLRLLDYYRFNLFLRINDYLTNGRQKEAKKLMRVLDKYAPEDQYPYQSDSGQGYADQLRERL